MARSSTSYDRSQLERCGKGEVSYWADSNTRVPADAESCQPCLSDNTYAPRIGRAFGGVDTMDECVEKPLNSTAWP